MRVPPGTHDRPCGAEKEPLPPTAEVVERVAAAMRQAQHEQDGGGSLIPWNRAAEGPREAWLVCARAAIEAMREPTQAMVLAADGAVEAWRKTLSRDEAFLRHYTPRARKAHTFIASATPEEKHAIRYRAMIDAALGVAPVGASPAPQVGG